MLVGSAFVADQLPSAEGKPGSAVLLDGMNLAPGDVAVRAVPVSQLRPSARQYRVSVDMQPADDTLGKQLILTVSTLGSSCEKQDGTFLFRGRAREVVLDASADGLHGMADTLCLQVELPLAVSNAVQGKTVFVVLSVAAE